MEFNLLFLVVLLVLVFKISDGYKKGMVKEIISMVSLVVMCVVVLLIGSGLAKYFEQEFAGVAISVVLLILLGIAHSLLGVVFFSAKMIVKLPIISFADKLLGIVVGAIEVILLLWTVYSFILLYGCGDIGQWVLANTQTSKILTIVYENNLLAPIIGEAISNIPDLTEVIEFGKAQIMK
ncbi:MAG: CvpA family protein [Lachnospiraceae bacterium]|nr:CvpA family protein [Lachnospiraceae bacterium]